MLRHLRLVLWGLSVGLLLLSTHNGYAQAEVPPPLNPFDAPWPAPGGEIPPSAPPGMPPGTPIPPPIEEGGSFDPFADEDDFGGGGGGFAPAPKPSQGKPSFMLLSPEDHVESCQTWVHELESKVFPDQDACLTDLRTRIKVAQDNMSRTEDNVERAKLKSVIKGHLNREQSKGYSLQFDALKNHLEEAKKQRCVCKP